MSIRLISVEKALCDAMFKKSWAGDLHEKYPDGHWITVGDESSPLYGRHIFVRGEGKNAHIIAGGSIEHWYHPTENRKLTRDERLEKLGHKTQAYQLTKDEWKENVKKFSDLTDKEKERAIRNYVIDTDDETAIEHPEKTPLITGAIDRRSGKILGEDIDAHDLYVKNAVKEGKQVSEEVKKDYPQEEVNDEDDKGKPDELTGAMDSGSTIDEQRSKSQPYETETGIHLVLEDLSQFPSTGKQFFPPNIVKQLGLMKHQWDAVNLAMEKFESGEKMFTLADSTGAGKTRQEIAIAVGKAMENKRVLIVTDNKRIINTSFANDAKAMGVNLEHIDKAPEGGLKPGGIYITTYNRLPEMGELATDLVVYDESHNMKNRTSQKGKAGIERIKNSKNVLLSSATPIDKAEQCEYFAVSLGMSYSALMRDLGYRYDDHGRYGTWERAIPLQQIYDRIDAMYSMMTASGLMLKREVSMKNLEYSAKDVKLSQEYKAKYDAETKQMAREVAQADPQMKGIVSASGLMRCRRLLEEAKIGPAVETMKKELAEGRQVVLFATRVNESEMHGEKNDEHEEDKDKIGNFSDGTMKAIMKHLDDAGIKYGRVFGEEKEKNKKTAIDDFNSGKVKVILTTPESGGTGINLDDTTGNAPRTAILMTPPFSAQSVVQMLGRINRLKTKSKASAIMLKTDTEVDEWNHNIIANKLGILAAAVKGDYDKIDLRGVDQNSETELLKKIKESPNVAVPSPSASPAEVLKGTTIGRILSQKTKRPEIKTPTITEKKPAALSSEAKKKLTNRPIPVYVPFDKKDKIKELASKIAKRDGVDYRQLLNFDGESKTWLVDSAYIDEMKESGHMDKYVRANVPYDNKDMAKRLANMKWTGSSWLVPEGEYHKIKHLTKSLGFIPISPLFQKAITCVS